MPNITPAEMGIMFLICSLEFFFFKSSYISLTSFKGTPERKTCYFVVINGNWVEINQINFIWNNKMFGTTYLASYCQHIIILISRMVRKFLRIKIEKCILNILIMVFCYKNFFFQKIGL